MLRLLGPVELSTSQDGPVGAPMGSPRQRMVLAALAVDAGRPVSVDLLVERVWGTNPPPQVERTLHTYIARARRLLESTGADAGGPARVHRHGRAYLLQLDPDRVDVHRFRSLVATAREASRTTCHSAELFREALELWRGQPLAGLDNAWVHRIRQAWQQERVTATVAWADAELAAGDPARVLQPITDLADEHPLVESLAAASMRVLARLGRTAEALQRYQSIRRRLADELGVDPGAQLRAIHQAVLRGECEPPALVTEVTSVDATSGQHGEPIPVQLPLDPPVFAGRQRELAILDTLVANGAATTTSVVAVVSGTAGIGKTALAVRWAHQISHQFPDGQFFINLRGFSPSGHVMDPSDVVRRFLGALGVRPDRIPDDLDARAALYRSMMANRRMLIVLDNAHDAAQVRPLLPGTPTCAVLVTSRNKLAGLLVGDGGYPVALDFLSPDEAMRLLVRRTGADRLNAEPDAVQKIISRCARLPLALAIAAAHAATHPQQPLAELADALRDTDSRLDLLAADDDPASDVRAVFSWSYQDLTEPAAQLFRLLALHPGPDISVTAAASLAGVAVAPARAVMSRLANANLVTEPTPGRYALHDLLRAYAWDLTQRFDSRAARGAATRRMLDHYLDTATAADRLLYPARAASIAGRPGSTLDQVRDHDQALGWFTAEHTVLLATIQQAAVTGYEKYATQLARSMADYLDRHGHWHDLVNVQEVALSAADRAHDVSAQIDALHFLALAAKRLERLDEARTYLLRGLDLTVHADDRVGQGRVHQNLAMLGAKEGEYAKALDHINQALALFQACGHQRGEALALNGVGWCHTQLGNHQLAISACASALALLERLGDRPGQSDAWRGLARAHFHLGRHTEAVHQYQHCVDLLMELDHRYLAAGSLADLGEAHHAGGQPEAAQVVWRQALAILTDLGHPDADRLRTKLAELLMLPGTDVATTLAPRWHQRA